MSQAGIINVGGGTNPPVESFIVQTGTSPVVPIANTITFNGATVAAGTNPVRTDGTAPGTMALEVQTSQAIASTDATKIGLAAFNSADFTVDGNGFVSSLSNAINYTSVNFGMSPYTVLTTDFYISVDSSGGAITLNFPNAPTFKQRWIVKDRTGHASLNNITISTPGLTVTIDGSTSYVLASNFSSVQLLANNSPAYEVF